jgi:hypothetical protein
MGPKACLDVLGQGKISCPCRELNPRLSSLYCNYTDHPTGQNTELFKCSEGGTYSNHCSLEV